MISNIRRLMIKHGFVEEREIRTNNITGKTYECLQCGLRSEYSYCSYCLHFCPCGALQERVSGICEFLGDPDHDKLVERRIADRAGGIDAKPWKGLPKANRLARKQARRLRLR